VLSLVVHQHIQEVILNLKYPLLSGIGILFAVNVDLSCSNLVQVKNKYRYICGSKIVQGKPCGKKGFTSYQLEHTVLQLIADHVWNNHQEDKTAWYESEIEKASEAIKKLLKLATLTDNIEELADQINANKQKKLRLRKNFNSTKSAFRNSNYWLGSIPTF
jgi:hypothetical protein